MTLHSVLVIDSHDIVRFGMETLVLGCPRLRLVGSAATLAAGLRLVRENRPDVVVMDMSLRDSSGLDTVRAVVAAQQDRHVLVMSMHDELLYGEQVLALGAGGYIMKDSAQEHVIAATLAVVEGERWTSPALNGHIVRRALQRRTVSSQQQTDLTLRELEVLEQLKLGRSTKQIAANLRISPRTVDMYRARIKKKLRLRTGAELIAFASQHL
jgi:DNA-binding NarL/FixJ family response regulator